MNIISKYLNILLITALSVVCVTSIIYGVTTNNIVGGLINFVVMCIPLGFAIKHYFNKMSAPAPFNPLYQKFLKENAINSNRYFFLGNKSLTFDFNKSQIVYTENQVRNIYQIFCFSEILDYEGTTENTKLNKVVYIISITTSNKVYPKIWFRLKSRDYFDSLLLVLSVLNQDRTSISN